MNNYIKIGTWNIQGLVTNDMEKCTDTSFLDAIANFDILGLLETHTVEGLHDNLQIPGYNTHCFHRPKHNRARHGSGGITVLLKGGIEKGIKFLPATNKDYIWLELDHIFFGLNQTTYLCIAYIPPPDSTYSKRQEQNILDNIESEIFSFKQKGAVILMGDLNARVGTNTDLIVNDSERYLPLGDNYTLDNNLKERNSQDTTLDSRGKHLLEICIGAQTRILNGRKLGDSAGYFTSHQYNGSSVVDYAICSEDLLDDIPYFKVHNFIGTISDHCMISFSLKQKARRTTSKHSTLHDLPLNFKWHEDSEAAFKAALSLPKIQTIIKEAQILTDRCSSEHSIQEATDKLSSVFTEAAKISLKLRKKRNPKEPRKPWNTDTLKKMERTVIKRGLDMIKYQTGELRQKYFLTLKKYRKEKKYAKRHYINGQIEKLNDLHNTNPKRFWQILQDIKEGGPPINHADNIEPGAWYDYLSKLYRKPTNQDNDVITKELNSNLTNKNFNELDFSIGMEELLNAIKKLRNHKSPGLDKISNEMIKQAPDELTTCIRSFFNKIFTMGKYPKQWSMGYITNIHKKGSTLNPANYRSITITSSLGKLFNSIMSNRLQTYLNRHNLISKTQIGFEKDSSTSDHIFTLRTIIDKYTQKKDQKLYSCFIDFRQAFDRVWHTGLMLKLTRMGINNHFFKIIQSMYSQTSLCAKVNNKLTDSFTSDIGVRQGDNLSPTLFKIYINDLVDHIKNTKNTDSITLGAKSINALLYADDVVLLSTTKEGLQNCIDAVKNFSEQWKLELNLNKTKVLIFNKGGNTIQEDLYYGIEKIDCTDKYTYLGLNLEPSGSFESAINSLYNKGLKAMYKLNKLLDQNYNIETVLHIFDHTVKPVILYASEVWGTDVVTPNFKTLESFHKNLDKNKISQLELKFYRRLLQVRRNTPVLGIRGELGRHPLTISAIANSIKYLHTIENKNNGQLVKEALAESRNMANTRKSSWIHKLNQLKANLPSINTTNNSGKKVNKVAQKWEKHMKLYYEEYWANKLNSQDSLTGNKGGNKLRTYCLLKQNFGLEKYLTNTQKLSQRRAITQLRLSSHNLNIEAQRGTVRDPSDRICRACLNGEVENEEHFLTHCTKYKTQRDTLYRKLQNNNNFEKLDNHNKFIWILTNEDKNICSAVGDFILNCLEIRKNHLHNNH